MTRTNYSQTIARAKRQIASSSNTIADSKKRIYRGNILVNNSKTSLTNSQYRLVLSVTFLINYFLVATFQKLAIFLELESTRFHCKTAQNQSFLTPQENLQQIMTHPFKTGLCPYCSHSFPRLKKSQ